MKYSETIQSAIIFTAMVLSIFLVSQMALALGTMN